MSVRRVAFLSVVLAGQAANGLTLDASDAIPSQSDSFGAPVAVQGQVFYSDTVSRVSNAASTACLVSTGTNWKATGAARQADGFEAVIAAGNSVSDALAATKPVAIDGLSSNTPYLMFAAGGDLPTFVRFATGFAIDAETVTVEFGTGFANSIDMPLDVEERGDTGVFRNGPVVDALFAAFQNGEPIRITARSDKNTSDAEHYLSYTFEGSFDEAAFDTCLTELSDPEAALTVSQTPTFDIAPVTDLDPAARMAVRGMACNRDLDPNGAELVRLDGPIQGFATPIPYALVQRDDLGGITDIWSGDLWRISKTESGYMLAFSNSVTAQGPLDPQSAKACTRFAAAKCATLAFDDGLDGAGTLSSISVGSCYEELIAGAALQGSNDYVPGTDLQPFTVTPFSTAAAGSTTSTTSTRQSSTPPTAGTPAAPISIVETIGGTNSGGPKPQEPCLIDCETIPGGPGDIEVSAVPVPPAGLLLGGVVLLGAALRRRAGRA